MSAHGKDEGARHTVKGDQRGERAAEFFSGLEKEWNVWCRIPCKMVTTEEGGEEDELMHIQQIEQIEQHKYHCVEQYKK